MLRKFPCEPLRSFLQTNCTLDFVLRPVFHLSQVDSRFGKTLFSSVETRLAHQVSEFCPLCIENASLAARSVAHVDARVGWEERVGRVRRPSAQDFTPLLGNVGVILFWSGARVKMGVDVVVVGAERLCRARGASRAREEGIWVRVWAVMAGSAKEEGGGGEGIEVGLWVAEQF